VSAAGHGEQAASAYAIRDLRWQVSPEFRLEIPALELPSGRTTALLGRSASGKSTLLSLLGRVEGNYFERPEGLAGTIELRLDGETIDLLALSERELLKRRLRGPGLGFVFQREGLFPGRDAIDNVAWPLQALGARPREARQVAAEALAKVGLAPDRQVATLSGGERKRLAIARAIGLSPKVLLLDEPLTGLDPEALGGLRELLRVLTSEGRTMVIVTHQREDVSTLAHHLVFMDRGRVALAGPRDSLARELDAFFAGDVPRAETATKGST
jgi:ABC-type polar amino acid transport system ATPase subunit